MQSLQVLEDHNLLPGPVEDPDDLPHCQGEVAVVHPHDPHTNYTTKLPLKIEIKGTLHTYQARVVVSMLFDF